METEKQYLKDIDSKERSIRKLEDFQQTLVAQIKDSTMIQERYRQEIMLLKE